MEVTKKDLQDLINLCENQFERLFRVAKHIAQQELNRRDRTGRKAKYSGDTRERAKQRSQAFRDREKAKEAIAKWLSPEQRAIRQAERVKQVKAAKKRKFGGK